ncbi:MAG: 50S ribosomal protein L25/general stress protein Ctc [Candidatus Methylomirabilales bacterium]
MEFVDLTVERRQGTGKGVARKVRAQGLLPAVLYGEGESLPITVDPRHLQRALATEAGENVILNLTVRDGGGGMVRKTIVREVQTHPVSGRFLHADFLAISMERALEIEVPIELIGVPTGVKDKGGVLEHVLRALEVRCLPTAIPDEIRIDVGALDIGDAIHVRDLGIPEGVEVLADREQVVATVAPPAAVEVVEEALAPGEVQVGEAPETAEGAAKEAASPEAKAAGGKAAAKKEKE